MPEGETIATNFVSKYLLQLIIQGGFVAGLSAFVNGLISIFNQKESDVLVFLSTIFGAIVSVNYFLRVFFLNS
jgi:hypothetical protein